MTSATEHDTFVARFIGGYWDGWQKVLPSVAHWPNESPYPQQIHSQAEWGKEEWYDFAFLDEPGITTGQAIPAYKLRRE